MARRRSPSKRSSDTVTRFWVESNGSRQTVTSAAPSTFDLLGNLSGSFDVTPKGIKITRVIGRITAVPLVAPGAAAFGSCTARLLVANVLSTAAMLNPTGVGTQNQPWLHSEWWHQPYNAAPVAATQVMEVSRWVDTSQHRVVRNNQDSLFLCMGVYDVNNNWNYSFDFRVLVEAP